jgi:hypothetical protein
MMHPESVQERALSSQVGWLLILVLMPNQSRPACLLCLSRFLAVLAGFEPCFQ